MEKLEQELKKITRDIPIEAVSQGAEALVYRTSTHPYLETCPYSVIIKYRPPKAYRHPVLDAQLTKHRTLAEARILQRLASEKNVTVPKLVFVDARRGVLWMEGIAGQSVKQWIWDTERDGIDKLKDNLYKVGAIIGHLHTSGVVHGDLTTSNIMFKGDTPVLIDFGLGSQSQMAEDKAVDLYVLERAVTSTHPVHSETYNQWILEGYLKACSANKQDIKRCNEVVARLEEVRQRGRKRSMVG